MEFLASILFLFSALPWCATSPASYELYRMNIIKEIKNTASNGQKFFGRTHEKFLIQNDLTGVPLVGTFKWQECGNSTADLGHIMGFTAGPDPLKIPGPITVKFSVEIKETLDAPIKAQLTLKKRLGPLWIEIPCVDGVGSCTYDDMCDVLKYAVCPSPFQKRNIPCKCPFTKGNYTLPASTISVDAQLPSGDYEARIQLWYKSMPVDCVDLTVTIA